ncbi:MAG: LamB/YcsF family protein [Acidiferrobacterales bacterium]|nr:LamB/YcsF family protein [Acidiferrobacterales bacterium]
MSVLVNCDMGESYGIYKMGEDEKLMPLINLANVACGFHGSDPNHMRKTVELAKQNEVQVGAHPSLPDRQGFGRRAMTIERDELTNIIIYQIGALNGFLGRENMKLNHIKPHGALYGMAARDESVAHAICDAAEPFGVPLLGMKNTVHERVYKARGMQFLAEYYADLEYDDSGNLIITREHDPVDPKVAAERCRRAIEEGTTESVNGKSVEVGSDCICVHSDTPNAVDVAVAVREIVDLYTSEANQ